MEKLYMQMLAKLGYKKATNAYMTKADDMPITLNGIIDELNKNGYGNVAQDLELLVKKRKNNEDTFEETYRIKEFCDILTEQEKKVMKNIRETSAYSDINDYMAKIDETIRQMENTMSDMLPKLEAVMRNIMINNNGTSIEFEGTYIKQVNMKKTDLKLEYLYYNDGPYGGLTTINKDKLTPQSIYSIMARLKTGKYTVQLRRWDEKQ